MILQLILTCISNNFQKVKNKLTQIKSGGGKYEDILSGTIDLTMKKMAIDRLYAKFQIFEQQLDQYISEIFFRFLK